MHEVAENKGLIYEFGEFVVDPGERVLLVNGERIRLADKIFDTLLLLIRHNGRLLTKDEMMSSLWENSYVEEGNLSKNISRLRKILNSDGIEFIETLPKQGYRFLADVREINGDADLVVRREMHIKVTHDAELQDEDETSLGMATPGPMLAINKPSILRNGLIAGALAVLLGLGIYYFALPVVPVAENGMTRLTNNLADDDSPEWSPDGKKIAFTSNRDGVRNIYVMNADGTNVVRLSNEQSSENSPTWSPDGSRLLFESNRDGNPEIYVMNSDGSGQKRITFNPTTDGGPARFSPDGTRIVFARSAATEGDAFYNFDIYTMNTDGGDVRRLTTDPEYDAGPKWSPEGSKMIFVSGREKNFDVFIMNADGSAQKNLTNDHESEVPIDWTPDGQQIIYNGDTPAKREFHEIWIMDSDGSKRRQISSFADKTYNLSFSPAAKRFL